MATLIDAAEFTSNEVYQIQATDPVEGAASGASFSGTGISNQPHQQLANRTTFLKQRQGEGLYGPYSFPIAFPNACEIFMPVTLTPEGPGHDAAGDDVVMVSASYL